MKRFVPCILLLSIIQLTGCTTGTQEDKQEEGVLFEVHELAPGELAHPNLFAPKDSTVKLARIRTAKLTQIDYADSLHPVSRYKIFHFDQEGRDTSAEAFLQKGVKEYRRDLYTSFNKPSYIYDERDGKRTEYIYRYDAQNRLIEVETKKDGATIRLHQTTYDSAGREAHEKVTAGEDIQLIERTFNAKGKKLTEIATKPDGGQVHSTTFKYYPDDTTIHEQNYFDSRNPSASQYWEMDTHGEVITSVAPWGTRHERHSYDSLGRLAKIEKLDERMTMYGTEYLEYRDGKVSKRSWEPANGLPFPIMVTRLDSSGRNMTMKFFDSKLGLLERSHEYTYDQYGNAINEKERDKDGTLKREWVLDVMDRY